jgi:hypothetical protein
LEGFLYAKERWTRVTFPTGWITATTNLKVSPPEVSSEIQCDYLLTLLKKGRDLLQKAYGDQDPNTAKIAVLISRIAQ